MPYLTGMRNSIFGLIVVTLLFVSATNTLAGAQSWQDSLRFYISNQEQSPKSIDQLNQFMYRLWQDEHVSDSIINASLEVLDVAAKSNYEKGHADALLNVVRCYLSRYESSKSLEYALEASNLYQKIGDSQNYAYTLMQLGIIYYTQNNYAKSLDYYGQAVTIYSGRGDKEKLSTLYYLMAIDMSGLNKYKDAERNFRLAFNLKQELKDQQGMAECETGIAELFIQLAQPDSALKYIELANEFIIATNNDYGASKSSILKAKVFLQLKKPEEALRYAKDGIEKAVAIKARELEVDGYEVLYEAEAVSGNYKESLEHHKTYMSIRDSLYNEKIARNIARLESDYLLDKKQNEIQLLEKENQKRSLLLLGSLLIGLLFLALLVVVISRSRIKQKANNELKNAYENLRTTQEQLIRHEKLASLGQLTAGIAHEIKNPLNFVNNFSQVSIELIEELKATSDETDKADLLQDIEKSLVKIHHHGKRANNIVSNMLDHSRASDGEKILSDVNQLCSEYLNLSYQGMKANNLGFSCKISESLGSNIPMILINSQDFSRVLINIYNNSFYAMKKNGPEKPAELILTTQQIAGKIVIRIKDNGSGIPASIKEKIFQPFFTTKPPGEGTGLGLSMSYDIIRTMEGEMEVESQPDDFTEFIIILPIPT